MGEAEGLCLQLLKDSCGQEENTAALQTLQTILRNISLHPNEEKYRRIRKENASFKRKVWRHEAAQQFLMAVGWVEVDGDIMLLSTERVEETMALITQRLWETQRKPAPKPAPAPVQGDGVWTKEELEERQRLIDARKKAAEEREKKVKEEKQKIAEQIQADRQEASTREVTDSHAKPLPFGATFKKFEGQGGG